MLIHKTRYSFLSVVVRVNYYLQLFIKIDRVPNGAGIVRAILPLVFTSFLKVMGGSGNILYALLGSFCFEATHFFINRKKTTSVLPDDQEIPPTIPNVESFHE